MRVMMTRLSGICRRGAGVGLIAAALVLAGTTAARAQGADPNPGALTFTGGLDVPSVYFFRGIRQEADPKLTLFPYGDIGIALSAGDGGLKSSSINFGVWNSLHTGSSGLDGANERLHYEEDFYATLNLGFGGGVSLGTTFTAYTSPALMFNTVKELSFKVSKAHMLAPYGLIAFELGDNQADGGHFFDGKKGSYLELGVAPSWPLGSRASLAVPVKLGVSLAHYYENADGSGDSKFGFFDVGGLVTVPLAGIPAQFGAWNIHGGADVLVFGDTTEALNVNADGDTKKSQVIALIGIGVSY